MQLNKRLDSFELKLRQLASKIERQEREKANLAKENSDLKRELDRQHGVVSALREKLSHTQQEDQHQPANATQVPAHVRNQLDECIRELDLCIEWLENH